MTPGSPRAGAIGWYAHHHGHGHLLRAGQVAAHLDHPVTLLTSAAVAPGPWSAGVVDLAPDVASPGGPDPLVLPVPPALHWAPGDLADLRRRTAQLATWMERAAPAAMVVDVSVEVALQARLAGVPVAWVRQHGRRTDPAHRGAYAAASVVVSPWPAWLDAHDPIAADVPRQVHVGGFSRFERRTRDRAAARDRLGWDAGSRHVVVTLGGGGHDLDLATLVRAAHATPGWCWTVLGVLEASAPAVPLVATPGWVADPWPYLVGADVVVAAAGHNAVVDAGAAGANLVVVPQPRPWDEQVHKAELLDRHGLAHVWPRWPGPTEVAARLDAVVAAPRTAADLLDGRGAARAAEVLDELVSSVLGHREATSPAAGPGAPRPSAATMGPTPWSATGAGARGGVVRGR